MNRFLRAGITVVTMALIFNVVALTETNAQGILGEILTRMDKHSKSLASLKADLKMVKDYPVFDEIDTYEGSLTFLPKTSKNARYARIDWEKPRAESIAVRGQMFEAYVPSLKTLTTGKSAGVMKPSGALSLLSISEEQLKANYVIDYVGQEQISGGVQTWHLRVTPKNRTGYYRFSDIWVDGDGMPLQVTDSGGGYYSRPVKLDRLGLTPAVMAMVQRMEEDTGVKINCDIEPIFEFVTDTTTIRLSRLKKNEPVEGSIFKINVPKGTKVITG